MTVCGAPHPTPGIDVTCERETGPNGMTDAVYEYDDEGFLVRDENGEPVMLTPPQPVHVHGAHDEDGGTYRWEDAPASTP